ncbi:MAG TPA: sulfite exporter TauE/SafE family protein [Casimicrobiaceae bacterium]|nr:sulfite exporter TauE/SafE family protein [Casimicrobiaceae bacterium]
MFSLPTLAILAAAIVATSFLSGIFGMAGGMVLMGLLLALMPLPSAMVLHGITQMTSNGWRAWVWRAHVAWGIVGRFAAGSLLSALGFAAVAVLPSKGVALLILGLTPFLALALPAHARLNVVRPMHAVAGGAICMVLQLLAGVSGPILDTFFVQSGLGRRGIVATKAAVQTLGHFVKLVYFGAALAVIGGELSPLVVVMAIGLAIVGTQTSRHVLERISDEQFRRWSRGIIMALSIAYVGQGVYLLHAGS